MNFNAFLKSLFITVLKSEDSHFIEMLKAQASLV